MEEKKVSLLKDNYPNNSIKKRTEEVKKTKAVAKASVKKKSFWDRTKELFSGSDGIGNYILHDVLIPAVKNGISDAIEGGVDALKGGVKTMIYGEHAPTSRGRDRDRTYVSYNSISSNRGRDTRPVRRSGGMYDFSSVILDSRISCEKVIDALNDTIYDYQQVTVYDFLELVGVRDSNYNYHRYGWFDVSRARIVQVRGGYYIDMPKPVVLV